MVELLNKLEALPYTANTSIMRSIMDDFKTGENDFTNMESFWKDIHSI